MKLGYVALAAIFVIIAVGGVSVQTVRLDMPVGPTTFLAYKIILFLIGMGVAAILLVLGRE